MKKLLFCLAFILTGCGGGGGGVAPPTPVPVQPKTVYSAPAVIPDSKMRLAKIDYRYDTPAGELDSNGNPTTSFASVKLILDQIKEVGFNGVVIQIQTPINPKTGTISFTDQYGTNKSLPKDLDKVIVYSKELKLKVWLTMPIVDAGNDFRLVPNFNLYSAQTLFDNIATFQKAIATSAEKNKVDGIFVSEGTCELHSQEHVQYWVHLINAVRSTFSGKISYASYCGYDLPIWQYVDYIALFTGETLSNTPVTDLKSIVNLYYSTTNGTNLVSLIKSLSAKYNKKVILLSMPLAADSGVNATPPTFFDMMETNVWGYSAYPNLSKYVSYDMQRLKIKAFLEIVGRDMPDIVDGVLFDGYNPWLSNVEFSKPTNAVFLYYCCGSNLTFNDDTQKVINSYFSQPWGYHTVK